MSRRKPGRTRINLAKILCDALPDVDVQPEDLCEAQGYYRITAYDDTYRWECFARLRAHPNVNVVFGSFSSMTDCVRHGVVVTRGRRGPLDIDVDSVSTTKRKA